MGLDVSVQTLVKNRNIYNNELKDAIYSSCKNVFTFIKAEELVEAFKGYIDEENFIDLEALYLKNLNKDLLKEPALDASLEAVMGIAYEISKYRMNASFKKAEDSEARANALIEKDLLNFEGKLFVGGEPLSLGEVECFDAENRNIAHDYANVKYDILQRYNEICEESFSNEGGQLAQ